MPYKVKNGNERAWKDANGNYVPMLLDEENNVLKMQRCNPDGALQIVSTSKMCTTSSTVAQLGIDEVFTGPGADINGYATIMLSMYSDQDSATDGLSIQFSHDNDPYDWHEADAYTYIAGLYKTYSFQPVDQYFRVVYTNGGVATNNLHISVRLHSSNVKGSSHRMADDIKGQDDAELVKAILAAEKAGGTPDLYTNIKATTAGNLKVSVEEYDPTVVLPQSNTHGYNGTNWHPISIDTATRSVEMITHEHNEVHEGEHYFVDSYADIAINHVYELTFLMPNTTKWIHWTWELQCEAETLYQIYEGASVITPLSGTITPLNSNRNSANTSGTVLKYEDHATLAVANTKTDVTSATLIESGIIGSGRTAGIDMRSHEIILKQNTLYVLRATATAAGYQNYKMQWYEFTHLVA